LQLKALRQRKARREQPRGKAVWGRQPINTGLLWMYTAADHSSQIAVDFMMGKGSSRCKEFHGKGENWCKAYIEKLYLRCPILTLASLIPQEPSKTVAQHLFRVGLYMVEHQMYVWTDKMNTQKGLAPTRGQLQTKASSSIPSSFPETVRIRLRCTIMGSTHAWGMFVCRWRKRWGCRFGKVPARSKLDTNVIRDRVRCSES